MLVKLKTPIATANGSWGPGLRDLPDTIAAEMLAAGFAEKVKPVASASPTSAKTAKAKEKRDDQK